MAKRSYYDILQVSPDANQEVITSAYRTLMTKSGKHPDLGGDTDEAARINEAYEVLSDSRKRAEYDRTIAAAGSAPASTADEKFEERRRVPRHEVNATVSFCVGHNQTWHPARVKDVSILGIRLQSHVPFEVGQHIVIAPTNLASSAFHGMVKWKRMFHPSNFERVYEAGIEFSDQVADVEERLNS